MKQEDKDLLLKDLCARLPYGVKIELMPITRGKCVTLTTIILQDYFISDDVNYLPYLRPMSSMTKEEVRIYHSKCNRCVGDECYRIYDYLNSIHVDYRELIPKGLALPAPEGMYEYK